MNLSKQVKISRHANAAAAATTDVEPSSGVDMQGFEGVLFLVPFGAITGSAVTSIKAQQSDDNGVADGWSDIADSGVDVADDDDNQIAYVDVYKPLKRYVRCVVDRGTQNAVVDGIVALQYEPRAKPVTHDATTVVGGALVVSPDEGTA
jgi:hypothetical protein